LITSKEDIKNDSCVGCGRRTFSFALLSFADGVLQIRLTAEKLTTKNRVY
jgi:hypothetical protein